MGQCKGLSAALAPLHAPAEVAADRIHSDSHLFSPVGQIHVWLQLSSTESSALCLLQR